MCPHNGVDGAKQRVTECEKHVKVRVVDVLGGLHWLQWNGTANLMLSR